MPTNDYEKTAAELCDCISCDVADPCPQVFCNAPEIAEALAAARMEGRLDIAKVIGSDDLERALRHAIEVATRARPGHWVPTGATVTMLKETIKAHSAYHDRTSGNHKDGVLSPPQV